MRMHFSNNAKQYDHNAKIQITMVNKLMDLLKNHVETSNRYSILDIGCGTGYLTYELYKTFPNSFIIALDIAPGMIEICKNKIQANNIKFVLLDIEEINENQYLNKFDLIVSNATFQWFNNPVQTFSKLTKMLKKDGLICFSSFGENNFNELHQSYKMAKNRLGIKQNIQPGQTIFGLDKWNDIINMFDIPNHIDTHEFEYFEHFEKVTDFLHSVKKIGANNSNSDILNTYPYRFKLIKEMIDFYKANFKENNKIKATYHCIFMLLRY